MSQNLNVRRNLFAAFTRWLKVAVIAGFHRRCWLGSWFGKAWWLPKARGCRIQIVPTPLCHELCQRVRLQRLGGLLSESTGPSFSDHCHLVHIIEDGVIIATLPLRLHDVDDVFFQNHGVGFHIPSKKKLRRECLLLRPVLKHSGNGFSGSPSCGTVKWVSWSISKFVCDNLSWNGQLGHRQQLKMLEGCGTP